MYASLGTHLLPQSTPSGCRCGSCYLNSRVTSISASLDNIDLWREFEELGTEMIITKLGRRLFPSLKVKLRGLDPDVKYWVSIDVIPLDSVRYKFVNASWVAVAGAEPHSPTRHVHCERPQLGKELMKDAVTFQNLKLTNQREAKDSNQIILNSMHKYLPRIHITPVDAPECTLTFTFPETAFMAVTAYQNKNIVRLKINNNPYAKGFRDSQECFETRSKKRPADDDIDDDVELEKRKQKSERIPELMSWKKPELYQLPVTNCCRPVYTTPTWSWNHLPMMQPLRYSLPLPFFNSWPCYDPFNCSACNLISR